MPHIRPIPKERAAHICRMLYETTEKETGATPNIFRTMAHRPELLVTFGNFYRELWTGGVLERKIKELVAVRVAALDACQYWLARHLVSAREVGLTGVQVAAVASGEWEKSTAFDDREKAVLRFVDKVVVEPSRISDGEIGNLRKWFGEAHLTELVLLAGTMNLLDRFANAFGVELP
jgi:AhpD family alkylhydroperoxidase